MRKLVHLPFLTAALLVTGCGNDASFLADAGLGAENDDAETDIGECKIEDADIGVENLALDVGGETVTFHTWVTKADEANEFIGFSWTSTAPVTLLVKAGPDVFAADGGLWAHPAYPAQASASAVSNVSCDSDDGPGDPDDDDNGDPDDTDPESGDPDD